MNSVIEEVHIACRMGDSELLSRLIATNPQYVNCEDKKLGWSGLYRSVVCNQLSSVNTLLALGADVNNQNTLGKSPLHQAAFCNFTEIAQVLLERGADPNLAQNDGDTPLHHACMKGNLAMVELLLKFNADPTKPNAVFGKTPIDLAIENDQSEILNLFNQRKNKASAVFSDKSENSSKDSTFEPESEKTTRPGNCKPSRLHSWLCSKKLECVYENLLVNGYDDLTMMVTQMKSAIPLSQENLKNIGISKSGHRMWLLASLEIEAKKGEKLETAKPFAKLTWCSNIPPSPGNAIVPTLEEFLDSLELRKLVKNFVDVGLEDYEQLVGLMGSSYPITEDFLKNEVKIEKSGYRHRILSRLNKETVFTGKSTLKIERDNVITACECSIM